MSDSEYDASVLGKRSRNGEDFVDDTAEIERHDRMEADDDDDDDVGPMPMPAEAEVHAVKKKRKGGVGCSTLGEVHTLNGLQSFHMRSCT